MKNSKSSLTGGSPYLLEPQWQSVTNQLLMPDHYYEQIQPKPIKVVEEALEAFQSGVGSLEDLRIIKQYEEEYRELFDVTAKVYGYRSQMIKQYPAVRFNYRLKANGVNHVPTTEGKATIQIEACPIEDISYTVVKFAIRPVKVNVRIQFEVEYYEINKGTQIFQPKRRSLYTDPFELTLEQQVEHDPETGSIYLASFERVKCSDQTILQLIRAKALTIPAIAYSDKYYGINFYSVVIEDDYAFDLGDESVRYHHERKRIYEVSTFGTFKVFADMKGNEYDVNSFLYYEGFANEGFFLNRIQHHHQISLLDGASQTLFTQSELDQMPLSNVDDASEGYMSPAYEWFVMNVSHPSQVELSILTTGPRLITALLKEKYVSEALLYQFDDVETSLSLPFYKVVSSLPYHLTRQYHFKIKSLNCTPNVLIMGESVAEGESVSMTGTVLNRFKLFSTYATREEPWELYFPALNEPGLKGTVNGDFIHLPDGKRDYEVYAPSLNLPDTVDQLRYRVIFDLSTETEHSITVRFDHEYKPGVGSQNNDKITFSSSVYYLKEQDMKELLFEHRVEDYEIESLAVVPFPFHVLQPELIYAYKRYELELISSNQDVDLIEYPTDLQFINQQADLHFTARILQNATGRWSPKIHNGFYYLNQHEFYMPSRFQVEADFIETTNYEEGEASFTLQLELVDDEQHYQDHIIQLIEEDDFDLDQDAFIFKEGLIRPKPLIETAYYTEYQYRAFLSSVVEMPNVIEAWGMLNVELLGDNGAATKLYARSLSLENGEWTPWIQCFNGEPLPLPRAQFIQFKAEFIPYEIEDTATITETDCGGYFFRQLKSEDSLNVNLEDGTVKGINDTHPTTFVTKVIDYGTPTRLTLKGKGSSGAIEYYVATSHDEGSLGQPVWRKVRTYDKVETIRYARFKVVIPAGEELYLLHRTAEVTLKNVGNMGIGNFVIRGASYESKRDIKIIKAYTHTIPYDNQFHVVSTTLNKVVKPLLQEYGYDMEHLHYLVLTPNDKQTEVRYDLDNYKNPVTLCRLETKLLGYQSPKIKVYNNQTVIKGIPQQFSPLLIETDEVGPLTEVFFKNQEGGPSLRNEENILSKGQRIFPLQFLDFDFNTLTIEIEGVDNLTQAPVYYRNQENEKHFTYTSQENVDFFNPTFLYVRFVENDNIIEDEIFQREMNLPGLFYGKYNYFLEFNQWIPEGAKVKVTYCLRNSFVTELNEAAETIKITMNTDEKVEEAYLSFETNQQSNYKTLDHLSLNPLYSSRYDGFIYLSNEKFEPVQLHLYSSHTTLRAHVLDRVYVYLQVLDRYGNPVPNEPIAITEHIGAVVKSSDQTDLNGVIKVVYTSPKGSGEDRLCFTCESNGLQERLKIKIV